MEFNNILSYTLYNDKRKIISFIDILDRKIDNIHGRLYNQDKIKYTIDYSQIYRIKKIIYEYSELKNISNMDFPNLKRNVTNKFEILLVDEKFTIESSNLWWYLDEKNVIRATKKIFNRYNGPSETYYTIEDSLLLLMFYEEISGVLIDNGIDSKFYRLE